MLKAHIQRGSEYTLILVSLFLCILLKDFSVLPIVPVQVNVSEL